MQSRLAAAALGLALSAVTRAVAARVSTRRAAAAASPPPPHPSGLTPEQADAIDENADAIVARIDAKSARLRRAAGGRAAVLVAGTAVGENWGWRAGGRWIGAAPTLDHPFPAARFSALAAGAAFLLLALLFLPFARRLAKQASSRSRTQATIAAARSLAATRRRGAAAATALTGVWLKDAAASEPMDAALDAMQLKGLVRAAIQMVKGISITVDSTHFSLSVFSALPLLKVSERYPLSGDPVEHRRRDLRPGKAAGRTTLRADGVLVTALAWRPPAAGACVDQYRARDGTLLVTTTLKVGGGAVKYRTVYRRQQGG
jgi:hypothetical protein